MTRAPLLPTFALLAAFAAPAVAFAQDKGAAQGQAQQAKEEEEKVDYGTLIHPGENNAPSRVEVVSADVVNVGVDEGVLESTAALTQPVLDEAGHMTTLQTLAAGRPIVLQFGYYRCPVVCPQILGNLARQANAASGILPGRDYAVVSLSLDPKETQAEAAQTRAKIMPGVKPELAKEGWYFLTAPQATITELTQACGYRYNYRASFNQFVHPDVLVMLSPKGKIVRFLPGAGFTATQLEEAVAAAKAERAARSAEGTAWGKCFDQLSAAPWAKPVMMGGGILMLGAMGGGFLLLRRAETRRRAAADPAAPATVPRAA